MAILIAILLVSLIALLIHEFLTTGTIERRSITSAILIAASVCIGSVKLISMWRGERRMVKFPYRERYAEIIGNAFSDDPKLEKRLFSAIDAFRSYNFAKSIKILNSLFPDAKCADERFCILFFSARCYYFGKYYDTAAKLYEKAFDIKESSAVASNLGLCYDEMGDADKAVAWYSTAITLEPDNAHAYNNMGYFYMNNGEYEKALEFILKAIEIKYNFEEALSNATICYAMLGDKENYEKYLRTAIANGSVKEEIVNYLTSLDAPVLEQERK